MREEVSVGSSLKGLVLIFLHHIETELVSQACTICSPTDLEKRDAGCSWLGLGAGTGMKSEALEDAQLHPWPPALEKPGAAPLSVTTENASDAGACLALGWGTAESLPHNHCPEVRPFPDFGCT